MGTVPANPTTSTSASFTFSSNEVEATFMCSLDGALYAECISPVAYTGLAVGEHTFLVYAVDAADLPDPSPASYTWTIEPPPDTTAPVTTIDSGPDAVTIETSATFTFSANEADVTFLCSLDLAAYGACTSPVTYTGLAFGDHTFAVYATDLAGNVGIPVSYGWTVEADTTPPEVTIDVDPDAYTTETGTTFFFSSYDDTATFECALDGTAFAACTSPVSYSGLSFSVHTFEVRGTDPAGNVGAPASYTWRIIEAFPDPVIVTSIADAWIDQGSPNTNKGDDSILKVMSKGPANNMRALV